MNNNNQTTYHGIGVAGLLGVAFVILKLCHVINWSWWWVTAPFWGPFGVGLVIILIGFIIGIIGVALEGNDKNG